MTSQTKKLKELKPKSSASQVKLSVYERLKAQFPFRAYSVVDFGGFDYVSLNAQHALDRMNEVVGLSNWAYETRYEVFGDNQGIVCHYKLKANIDGVEVWREATGASDIKKDSKGVLKLDAAYKMAATSAQSKCLSKLGVGDQCYKGELNYLMPVIKIMNETFMSTKELHLRVVEKYIGRALDDDDVKGKGSVLDVIERINGGTLWVS